MRLAPVPSEGKLPLLHDGGAHSQPWITESASDSASEKDADAASVTCGVSWLGAAWVLLADVVGTGLLTMNYVAAQLGWAFTAAWLLGGCLLAAYNALLMSETFLRLSARGITVTSMGEAARYTLGGRRTALAVFAAVYGYALLGNASYLLVLGQALRGAVRGLLAMSLRDAVLLSSVLCTPLVCAVRKVRDTTTLSFGNSLILYAVMAIVLGSLALGSGGPAKTELVARDLDALTFFGASTNVLYAFSSHWLYFELMSEMEDAAEFPKVVGLNAPLQLLIYFLTAGVSYYYLGGPASALKVGGLIEDMPPGEWAPLGQGAVLVPNATSAAQGLLFLHVVIVFLVKTVVLTRFLALCLSPALQEKGGLKARCAHAACAIALLLVSIFLSLALPFFNLFLGLVGGLLAAPISYLLPVLFYVGALGRFDAPAPPADGSPVPLPGQAGSAGGASPIDGNALPNRQLTVDSVVSEAATEPGRAVRRMHDASWRRHESDPCVAFAHRLRRRASCRAMDALVGRSLGLMLPAPPDLEPVEEEEEEPAFDWDRLKRQLVWHEWVSLAAVSGVAILCSIIGTTAQVQAILAAAGDR